MKLLVKLLSIVFAVGIILTLGMQAQGGRFLQILIKLIISNLNDFKSRRSLSIASPTGRLKQIAN